MKCLNIHNTSIIGSTFLTRASMQDAIKFGKAMPPDCMCGAGKPICSTISLTLTNRGNQLQAILTVIDFGAANQ